MGAIGKSQVSTGLSSALAELDQIKQRSDNDREWHDEYGYDDSLIKNPLHEQFEDDHWEKVNKVFDILSEKSDQLGINNLDEVALRDSKVQEVNIKDIDTLQDYVEYQYMRNLLTSGKSLNAEKGYTGNGEIILVKYGKKYYVLDGNHRAAALKLTGAKKIKANVWNAGGK